MTAEQAKSIVDRLCIAFRYEPKSPQKAADEFKEWIEHLVPVSYERADEAVRRMIRSGKFRFMPNLPEFLAYMDSISGEGTPNAIAKTPPSRPIDRFGLWRQKQIEAMTDEQYWQFITDRGYQDQVEADWQQQWTELGGEAS